MKTHDSILLTKTSMALAAMFLMITVVGGLGLSNEAANTWEAHAANNPKPPTTPLEKAFPHSQKCKRCHLRAYEEWEASAQSQSIQTSAFRITLDRFLNTAPRNRHTMCFQCHAPHIQPYEHLVGEFIDEVTSKNPQIDGVGCSQCHLISAVDSSRHPPHPTFTLSKTMYGGYDNPVSNLAHQSQYLELYKDSRYCVTCHDSLPRRQAPKKFSDWLGPWETTQANKKGKTCQTCHMPEAFGESANGEPARRIANHSFPGRFGKVRAKAVDLALTTTINGKTSEAEVRIQSLVPHNLPLPHPGWSRIILDLTILGKNLRKTYGEQRVYERVFADKNGVPTVLDFEAVKVMKDTLLLPEEKRIETFTFPTPIDAPSMDVIVTLSYAPIHGPEEFLQAIEAEATLGPKDRAFQTVEIAQAKQNVPL